MVNSNPGKTTTGPVKTAQPMLDQALHSAQGYFNSSAGYQPAPLSDLYTPYSNQTNTGIGMMKGVAKNPGVQQKLNEGFHAVSGIIGSGGGITTGGMLGDLYNNSGNQAFEQALDTQAGHLTDDINREFSGLGRTGSAAQSGAVADQVGNFINQGVANQWNQNVANQRGIIGDMSNVQGQNVSNTLSAEAAMPGAYQSKLLPAQTMLSVGNLRDQKAQQLANANLYNFQTSSQAPWNRLSQYMQMIGGPGQMTTTTPPTNPIGGAIGGGLLGAQIGAGIPGVGGGLGALAGGGLGLLGGLL